MAKDRRRAQVRRHYLREMDTYPLGLRNMLDDPRTPIRAFFDEEIHPGPDGIRPWQREVRAKLGSPSGAAVIEDPAIRSVARAGSTIGNLIGVRLQLAFTPERFSDGYVLGIPNHYDTRYGIAERGLHDRKQSLYRGAEHEAALLDYLLGGDGIWSPAYRSAIISDVRLQVEAAGRSLLEQLRARTQPEDCWVETTFAGSDDVSAAHADLLVDDILIEIKSSRKPGADAGSLRQLLAYALLDYNNDWSIRHLGIYYTRTATLLAWPISDVLQLLQTPTNLSTTRHRLRSFLRATRYG